ncbi:prominin-like protein isoform X1 [Drosophila santomea]|uniref:prominin-like protein isoform X1 n=3 Tax=Drosophila santomea TaxID=129105 RepID=UPI00195425D6|nr:prominin-like protein isoform X1 [Drosophila santomea]
MKLKVFLWHVWYSPIWIVALQLHIVKSQTSSSMGKFSIQNRYVEPESRSNDNQNDGDVDSWRPITYLPHVFTGFVVSDSENVPQGYISQDGNDIGYKVKDDDWKEYLASQTGLKILVLLLVLLFLLMPIFGLIYAVCCARCKNTQRSSKGMRYCCGLLLALLALLMLLFLIFAILAATQLHKNLKHLKAIGCHAGNSSKSNEDYIYQRASDRMHQQHIINYDRIVKRIQSALNREPTISNPNREPEVLAKAIERLSVVLQNMRRITPVVQRIKNELLNARRLATQFRDALRGVKRDLMVLLTFQCKQRECQDFYRANEIMMLDMGCLHYDSLPDFESLLASVQEVIDSKFISYPILAVKQLRQVSRVMKDRMSDLLDSIEKDLNKGAKELNERHDASLKVLRRVVEEMKKDMPVVVKSNAGSGSTPGAALRRKLGSWWFGYTLGFIVLLMLVPLILLLGLLIALSSPKVASWLLCAVLVVLFILFSVGIILVLFYLLHGALLHHAFCSKKSPQPVENKSINPNEFLPENVTTFRSMPMLRTSDILQSCVRNESLYNVLGLKEIYNPDGLRDDVMEDVVKSLEKMENTEWPGGLKDIHPEAEEAAKQLLSGNLSTYDIKDYTRHICRQLVTEPKPGPLNVLTRKLESLANKMKPGVALKNQATYLRAYQKHLGAPLQTIVQRLINRLKQMDRLFSGGYGSFTRYLQHLLDKIKLGDDFLRRDNKKLSDGVARNISKLVKSGLNDYVRMVDGPTKVNMDSCEPLTREEDAAMVEYADLCNRIVKPMNAIWFWLLLFSLLLLPAICCTHFLRCRLKSLKNYSEASFGESNFVPPGLLPMALPQCQCYKYLPVSTESNVDYLEGRDDYYYVDQAKHKRE